MADDSGKDDKVKTEPDTTDIDLELGDLSQFIDSADDGSTPELGDLSKLDSDFGGDLSLLDEAIAELESESDTNEAEGEPASQPASELALESTAESATSLTQTDEQADSSLSLSEENDDVPTLDEAVAEVSHSGETTVVQAADTVPTLSESAIIPTDESSAVSNDPLSDADAIGELESIAEQLLEEEQSAMAEQTESSATSGLSLLDDDDSPVSGLDELNSEIAAAEMETAASQFNESAFEAAMSQQAETPETDPFEDAPATSSATAPAAAAAGAAAAGAVSAAGNRFVNELQSHLASKIEALVMEAIASFGDDLNNQLALQIQEMIIRAIDNALPAIMETMADSLKGEVETQVKTELPDIIDKMLGDLSFAE